MQKVILVFSLIQSGTFNRLLIEPSIPVTQRVYHKDSPVCFKQPDDNWPKFFIGVPELNSDFNF